MTTLLTIAVYSVVALSWLVLSLWVAESIRDEWRRHKARKRAERRAQWLTDHSNRPTVDHFGLGLTPLPELPRRTYGRVNQLTDEQPCRDLALGLDSLTKEKPPRG